MKKITIIILIFFLSGCSLLTYKETSITIAHSKTQMIEDYENEAVKLKKLNMAMGVICQTKDCTALNIMYANLVNDFIERGNLMIEWLQEKDANKKAALWQKIEALNVAFSVNFEKLLIEAEKIGIGGIK